MLAFSFFSSSVIASLRRGELDVSIPVYDILL